MFDLFCWCVVGFVIGIWWGKFGARCAVYDGPDGRVMLCVFAAREATFRIRKKS